MSLCRYFFFVKFEFSLYLTFFLDCFSYELNDECNMLNGTYYMRTCYNTSYAEEHNITELALHALRKAPAEDYFK